ncbi:MAG: glycosyltransferase family 4 protein [Actinobacteria bacterium]|nr:glycosyltransferase family 4 protein [Actinomycetota bacterium]
MTAARRGTTRPAITFLGHAVDRTGPPIYLHHLLGWLDRNADVPTRLLSLRDGGLEESFRALTDLHVVGEPLPVQVRRGSRPLTRARNAIRAARIGPADPGSLVYINTSWSVRALRYLPRHRGPVVAHVHELEVGLDYDLPPEDRAVLFGRSTHWIAASGAVARNLTDRWGVPADEIHVHHEMIDVAAPGRVPEPEVAARRAELGLGPDDVLAGTAAVLNWRKAPDLFVEVAARAIREHPERTLHLAWVGLDPDSPQARHVRRDAVRAGIGDRLHLVAASDRPEAWMRAFDLFVLPAREDAYPLACLEAAAAARPIVCFDAGGMPEFVAADAGVVVDFPDVGAMARAVADIGADQDLRRRLGAVARARVVARHDTSVAAPRWWETVSAWMPA